MADEPENNEAEESTEAEGAAPTEEPAAEAPAEEPAAEAGESADAAAPTEPGAPTEAEAEAGAVPEDVPENAEPESPTPEPAAEQRPKAEQAEKRDVVPGADLEPIAIGEEERELTAEERARAEAEAEERAAREARATADDDDEELAPRSVTVPADASAQATGKRKSAVARVILRAGGGSFEINGRSIEQYFPSTHHQSLARQALVASGYDGSVDVRVRVHGGGASGQAGAVRHGVARALTTLEPELRGELKRRGMLTRDDRRKERKKAGLKKARKRPQFSKR